MFYKKMRSIANHKVGLLFVFLGLNLGYGLDSKLGMSSADRPSILSLEDVIYRFSDHIYRDSKSRDWWGQLVRGANTEVIFGRRSPTLPTQEEQKIKDGFFGFYVNLKKYTRNTGEQSHSRWGLNVGAEFAKDQYQGILGVYGASSKFCNDPKFLSYTDKNIGIGGQLFLHQWEVESSWGRAVPLGIVALTRIRTVENNIVQDDKTRIVPYIGVGARWEVPFFITLAENYSNFTMQQKGLPVSVVLEPTLSYDGVTKGFFMGGVLSMRVAIRFSGIADGYAAFKAKQSKRRLLTLPQVYEPSYYSVEGA